jgi:hypothetical protein
VSFAVLIVAGTDLASSFNWPKAAMEVTFIALIPIALVIINWLGVKVGFRDVFIGLKRSAG